MDKTKVKVTMEFEGGGKRKMNEEDEELWSTEVWLKNMMYYLKTEMFMFTGRL